MEIDAKSSERERERERCESAVHSRLRVSMPIYGHSPCNPAPGL